MSTEGLRRSSRNASKKDVAPPAPAPAPKKRATPTEGKPSVAKKAKTTAKAIADGAKSAAQKKKPAATATGGLQEGDVIPGDLPEVQTHDGKTITVAKLLEDANKGIIIFAYPKASTPGCTTQACLFRDNFSAFEDIGYTVYGLSSDSPVANTKFVDKQKLTYTLLCDSKYELHEKLGIKSPKGSTIRSVIVIEKTEGGGKILRKSPASPVVSLQIAKDAVKMEGAAEEESKKETAVDSDNKEADSA